MKNLILVFLFSIVNYTIFGQYNERFTTEKYNQNVNTSDNTTTINLFDLDYNGEKIPISIYYTHTGVQLDEIPSILGSHWKFNNIGYINTTQNHHCDYYNPKGWFYNLNPNFSSETHITSCTLSSCNGTGFNPQEQIDLSPDFFSVNLHNNQNFDFFYKKNIQNGAISSLEPAFLSNPDGYKINTNFINIVSSENSSNPIDSRIVFNILDKKGNNYDFIKGPNIYSSDNYWNQYNNYYLKSLYNTVNNNFLNIDYKRKEISQSKKNTIAYNYLNRFYSFSGVYTHCAPINNIENNNNLFNNIAGYIEHSLFEIGESRNDLKKITTITSIVDFVYTSDGNFLDEINVSDNLGNYLYGFKFYYTNYTMPNLKTLYQIKKYNASKNVLQTLYEFEYYTDSENVIYSYINSSHLYYDQANSDFFGYYKGFTNGINFGYNPLPFPVRLEKYLNNCELIPAADYTPDINFAKSLSLFRIKNKFSGITEFDYQLNKWNDSYYGNLYGGGLIMSSKKQIPQVGLVKYSTYSYSNLIGFTIHTENLPEHFIKSHIGWAFYNSVPQLFYDSFDYIDDPQLYAVHKSGNFFNLVTESNYDFASMNLESSITREYIPDFEGVYLKPLLKSETFKNSLNQNIKKINYNYALENIETVDRASYTSQAGHNLYDDNPIQPTQVSGLFRTTNDPIHIKRENLLSITQERFSNSGTITENSSFSYINNNSKLLRSKTMVSSTGDLTEERYFYPTDSQVATEPFVADLITKNIIGVPLKTEIYKGTEKISEQKTVYVKDASTANLLLPKYIYAKKGTDVNSILEKKITFNNYDTNGVLLQYTQENGVPVSIIWGYNKTVPIAKIENVVYTTIPANLITAAQNASNLANNEVNLLSALNDIRINSALVNAFVSTFTYKPVIGISTITDAKGDKITYTYDTFNRLQFVKDKSGNILSENQYNYKP